jgi:hypothetical protein
MPAILAMLALPLLVLGVRRADDKDLAVPADDLAFLADRFDGRTNFHCLLSF